MAGQCEVKFEAGGQTVVADLPVGSGGGKRSVGAVMTVRYQADDARVVAREDDVGGAVLFLLLSGVAAIFLARQRRS
ncbi:hypothetical protein [Streptomyces sp. rh34]|uniref:hypothetical protein n=1 Tax=Streptomyces sp. rh34 TaxID=2034272 RepID=UPI00211D57F2|nr:hypothetical protein [Streptomyces sp. rh34]